MNNSYTKLMQVLSYLQIKTVFGLFQSLLKMIRCYGVDLGTHILHPEGTALFLDEQV